MTILDYMTFSKNLKEFIAKKNWSLKDLADHLGVPSSTAHGWLNGVPPKNIKTLKKIAVLMECSIDELCFDENHNSHDPNINITIGETTFKLILKKVETIK
jgi:transcriptional regulator with XRE-family HTH domain